MENDVTNTFQKATYEFIKTLNSLSDDQLNKIPFPGSWTAGQVGDHILKSLSSWPVFNGNTSAPNRPVDENCKPLSELFLNFGIKMTAEPADFNYPADNYIMKDLLIAEIKNVTNEIVDFSKQNDLKLLCLDLELPTFGYLTRLEWLHFYTVHIQRHFQQLKNICKQLKAA